MDTPPRDSRARYATIRDLFPRRSEEELKRAEEVLRRYFEVVLRIYEGVERDPEKRARFMILTGRKSLDNMTPGPPSN